MSGIRNNEANLKKTNRTFPASASMLGSTRHCDDYNALIFCDGFNCGDKTAMQWVKRIIQRVVQEARRKCGERQESAGTTVSKKTQLKNLWKLKLRVPRRGQQILQFKTVRVEDWAKITRVTSFSIQEPSWVLNSIKYISVSLFNNFFPVQMFQDRTGAVPETESVAAYSEENNSWACVQIDPCETRKLHQSIKSWHTGKFNCTRKLADMLRPCHKLNRGGVGSGRTSEKPSCMEW